MPGLLIGYARVSTDAQDLTAQRDGLPGLGVELDRVYVDQGLTGYTARSPTRSSPGCPAGQMRRVTSAP